MARGCHVRLELKLKAKKSKDVKTPSLVTIDPNEPDFSRLFPRLAGGFTPWRTGQPRPPRAEAQG
jgi:hypothetical protein